MILICYFNDETKELKFSECLSENIAYYIINERPTFINNAKYVIQNKSVVATDTKINIFKSEDVIDSFVDTFKNNEYEKAYLYDDYFVYLYEKSAKFTEVTIPNVGFCKCCGKLSDKTHNGYCLSCYAKYEVKKEINDLYNGLINYTKFENVSKMNELFKNINRPPFNMTEEIFEKANEVVEEIFTKEKIPEEIKDLIKRGVLA